ncbi:MAG: hypothetical protein LBO73_02155 [Holosporaceae bacterium]|jgi:hypothetical protein|nr:hypothetical protein [Holosporaceae bacterium]
MRRFFPFLLLCTTLGVSAGSPYVEVKDIEVKQRGKNSVAAKQSALDAALHQAFRKALGVVSDVLPRSALQTPVRQIQDCLYDYSVDQEKFSDSVYIGRISYRFRRDRLVSLLKSLGVEADVGDDGEGEKDTSVKLAVHLEDFILNSNALREMNAVVEKFSDDKIMFRLNQGRIDDFLKLRIKYAVQAT